MTVASFEKEYKHGLNHEITHLINKVAQKIEQEGKIPDGVLKEKKLNELNKELEKEGHPLLSKEEVLEKALRQVKEKFGGFPNEKLKKIYKELIVERMAKEIVQKMGGEGEEIKYKLLEDCGKEAKKEKVNIGEELEERVDELQKNKK